MQAGNVVSLFKPSPVVEKKDSVLEFIESNLYPWAMAHGVDTEDMQFKLNAAAIMTCLQGILLNNAI